MKKFMALAERGVVILAIIGVVAMIVTHKPGEALPQMNDAAPPTTAEMATAPGERDLSNH